MNSVFTPLFSAITACFNWLQDVLDSTQLYGVVIGAVVLLIFWRLVITPLFGGSSRRSGSDKVDRKHNPDDYDY